MQTNLWRKLSVCVLLLLGSESALGQVVQQNRTLVVNGHSEDATVLQVNGRTYIDFETLARIANGSVGFQGNQVILTLPANGASPPPSPAGSEAGAHTSLSREFTRAAIEEITLLREWASPLANAIQNGFPVTESWVAGYRERAASGHRLAATAVSTDADRNAFQLLSNEFDAVEQWSHKLVESRTSMGAANYALSAGALKDDPLSQKIVACAHFLAPMLTSGSFQDNPSCH
jgi:hypothetical protein